MTASPPAEAPPDDRPRSAALSHLRVLDMSRVVAGPWAAQILGDLGADVIKVERPGSGDDTRALGPPFLKDEQGRETADALYFLSANRNKKSIAIDFTRPEGQRLIRELAAGSDVLIENYRVGALQAYGLDHASMRALNPRLVYCSITGFGQDGPHASRGGYDLIIQAASGLMSMTGRADGEPGAGPLKVAPPLADVLTGVYAATAVLAALAHREVSGMGQHIDLALLEVLVASMGQYSMNYLYTGQEPVRLGNASPNVVPYQDFPTSDGHMIVAVANDGQFARLAVALGRPEWATDERFSTNAARVAHREILLKLIREATVTRTTGQWVEALQSAGVPCGPINGVSQVFADPQIVARGVRVTAPHARAGRIPLVASPIRLSGTPVRYTRAPPVLGEDTREVLERYLGVPGERIDQLVRDGVVATA